MFQLGQFNLQPTLTRPRTLRKNIENQLGAIQYLAFKKLFQIASLRGRKVIVKDNRINQILLAPKRQFFRLAGPNVSCSAWFLDFLGCHANDITSRSDG